MRPVATAAIRDREGRSIVVGDLKECDGKECVNGSEKIKSREMSHSNYYCKELVDCFAWLLLLRWVIILLLVYCEECGDRRQYVNRVTSVSTCV